MSRQTMYTTKTVATPEGEKVEIEDVIPVEETITPEEDSISKEAITPEVVKKSISYGRVACTRLRVRKEPSIEAEILDEIVNDETVKISNSESTDEFYKVTTGKGLEGYCMKSFIVLM